MNIALTLILIIIGNKTYSQLIQSWIPLHVSLDQFLHNFFNLAVDFFFVESLKLSF